MQNEMPKKGQFQARVLSNQQIRRCYYRLNMQFDAFGSRLFEKVTPGQFLELDLSSVSLPAPSLVPENLKDKSTRPVMLRRPFSFSDVIVTPTADGPCVKVEILYCVLGPATVRMMSLKKGDPVNILGPLGNGFSVPDNLTHALLIAGGMGSPPILHLASYLKHHYPNVEVLSFIGARNIEDLPFSVRIGNFKGLVLDEFESIRVPSHIATDDGSAGFDGFVTDCMRHWLEDNPVDPATTAVFSCGPEPMLASTAKLAKDYALPCQVSMERMMACGIGLCQSCVVDTKTDSGGSEYKLCCKNGPVFDAETVNFHGE
ncbi:MAG: dihydroorotate dehydrogenase electron transfer subunit [Planctomycetota bacterium]|jgi:dihydroorotate dehydrogenase electron transfer subunit